jgi:hypothetical protein
MFKNVASQKLTVFAFADAGHATLDAGDRVTGDAANISCKVEQDDDGTQSATNDVAPTEVEDGQYRFDLTQAETNGDKLTFYPESSTAGVQVICMPSNVIYTRPQYFGDLGIASDGDLTKVNTLDGHTAQTGDTFALANGAAGFVAIDTVVDAILADTGTDGVLLAGTATSAQLVDDVWDEATSDHNTGGTTGKALRNAGGVILHAGTADAGGANTIDLETGVADTNDDFYNHTIVWGGPGTTDRRLHRIYAAGDNHASVDRKPRCHVRV